MRRQQPRRAHHVLGLAEFEHDLVLPHHAADRRDLGNVRHRLQLVLQEPVLQRAQLAGVHASAAIDQRVLVDPADAGRVQTTGTMRGRGDTSTWTAVCAERGHEGHPRE
jgi:hypothetical protein